MVLNQWDESFSADETNKIIKEIALWHLSEVLEKNADWECIFRFLGDNDYHSLCHYSLHYDSFSNASDLFHVYSALALYKKRGDLDIGIDTEEAARRTFASSEALCGETNRILKMVRAGEFFFLPGVESRIFRAQRKISYCLGTLPNLEELQFAFGPGATTETPKIKACARNKLGASITCSEDLVPIASELLGEMPAWLPEEDQDLVTVEIGVKPARLSFVPKTAKTDRCIAVQPPLNGLFQTGIGKYLRHRLFSCGVDITDQTRNQKRAREGSLTGALATLDLSSASDTIATELVWDLLPFEWANLLSYGRCSTVEDQGKLFKINHFASQGNGFTFPLETLIFWALACSVVKECDEHLVSVYGDDIIIPTYAYEHLIQLLTALGFVINRDKSFGTGAFRESCGADYYYGINVRPFFLKESISCPILFVMYNFYRRNHLDTPAQIVLRHLGPDIILWGPDGYGDGHLVELEHDKLVQVLCAVNRTRGYAGYTFDTFTPVSKLSFKLTPGDRVLPVYTIYARDGSDCEETDPLEGSAAYFRQGLKQFARKVASQEPSSVTTSHKWITRKRHDDWTTSTVDGVVERGRMGVVTPDVLYYKRTSIYILTF